MLGKKKLKCTVSCTSFTCSSAVGILDKVGPNVWLSKGSNKILLAQNGVGVSLAAASVQLFSQQPLCLLSQPIALDSSQYPILRVGYETICGETLPNP